MNSGLLIQGRKLSAELLDLGLDAHGFGMAGATAADCIVIGLVGAAAGITRLDAGNPLDVLEHAIDTPEATAGKDRGLHAGGCANRLALGECCNGMVGNQDGKGQSGKQRRPAGFS